MMFDMKNPKEGDQVRWFDGAVMTVIHGEWVTTEYPPGVEYVLDHNEYTYAMRDRYPLPGAMPVEGLLRVDCKESDFDGHHFMGHAIYDRMLTEEETEQYAMEFCRGAIAGIMQH